MLFIQKYKSILAYSLLQIFFTAPGQTFLIALFVAPIFSDLGVKISHFAAIYSLATLLASLGLTFIGPLLDRWNLAKITTSTIIAMATGCVLLASANSLIWAGIAFFLLRLFGQGVFGLTGSTVLTKSFHKNRGRAIGIMTLGFPLSELVYPGIALVLLSWVGWRWTYIIFAISTLGLMLPVQLWLIQKSKIQYGSYFEGEDEFSESEAQHLSHHPDLTLSQAILDPKFYLVLAGSCIPPLVITGLFFHQAALFTEIGWPLAFAVPGLAVYAALKAGSAVISGPIIDKIGPIGPFVLMIILMGLGVGSSTLGGPMIGGLLYFGLFGIALGISSPVMGVLFANMYGTAHIGSIKGVVSMARNGFTALGPLPIALALDSGWTFSTILTSITYTTLLMAILPILAYFMDPQINR